MANTRSSGGLPSADGKTRVGNYEILSNIGEGATGTVFKARQRSMDRIVALKILKPRLATDKDFVERFRRDVRAVAQLNHPNIVRAYDTGRASGYFYFAMEYVDGHDLRTELLASVTLDETRALEIARDIARALECAHKAGAIHRDVRPENILLASNGTAKLSDLGLAHAADNSDTASTQAAWELDVPNYVSPEQARGDASIDSRTDIYSLGATLYHMLIGAPPYLGGSNAEVMSMHLTQPVPDARHANPNVSEYASALITKAMAKDRKDRYTTARELAADFEALLAGEPITIADPTPPPVPAAEHEVETAPVPPVMSDGPDVDDLDTVESRPVSAEVEEADTAEAQPISAHEAYADTVPLRFTNDEDTPTDFLAAHPPEQAEAPARSVLSARKIAALAAGFLILALVGIYALRPSAQSGPEPPRSEDARAFSLVEDWVLDHPGRYTEAIAKYELLKNTLTEPQYKSKAEEALRLTKLTRARTADKVFDRLKAKAEELRRSGAYTRAVDTYRSIPAEFQDILRPSIEQAIAGLNAEAAAKIKLGIDRARALLAKGDATAGMRELHKIAPIQHPALATERQELRKELEQAGLQQALAARKKINHILQSVDTPAMEGDIRRAASVARAATRDPALECVKTSVEALGRIGAALLKADALPEKGLAATTPDEYIAAAILALAAEDPGKMEAALKGAGEHQFLTHYAIQLQQLKERLNERTIDEQKRQQLRLAEFRGTLPALLKRRRFEQALTALNTIIATPQLALVKDDAMADHRALTKLASVMKRIRSSVRTEAAKAKEAKTSTRYRGIPATIEAYDPRTDRITFSGQRSDAIATMRAADLKALLALSPIQPAEQHESLALLFAADGDHETARTHLANAARRADAEHLIKIIGEAPKAAPEIAGDDPEADAHAMAKLTPDEKRELQDALAKNRELFATYWRTISRQREAHKKKYQRSLSGQWEQIEHEISSIRYRLKRGYYYYYRDYYYYYYGYRTATQLRRDLTDAVQRRGQLAAKIRNGISAISQRAARAGTDLRTVMLKNKRLLLLGRKISEEEMAALYEQVIERHR